MDRDVDPVPGPAELAAELGIPKAACTCIVPDFGGGFGGKHGSVVALEAARLARAAGRPVKVQWTRADEFTAGYLRPAAVIDVASQRGRRRRDDSVVVHQHQLRARPGS